MIEAFVSARTQGDAGLKKRGDIICAKLQGSPWGTEEQGGVVFLTDVTLEAELQAMQDAGQAIPVIIHPYAEYERLLDAFGNVQKVMVNRSQLYVDIDALTARDITRLESRTTKAAPLAEANLTTAVRTKETVGGTDEPSRTPPPTRTR